MFSPYHFNLYGEDILRQLGSNAGIKVGGYNINNFRYVNNTTIVSDSKEKLQHPLSIKLNENKDIGLYININKTICIIISKKKTTPTCELYIYGKRIRWMESFNYPGSKLISNGKCPEDIKKRTALAKASFTKMSKITKNRKLSMVPKLQVLSYYSPY